uniref:Uncharacterized protein n=1 Tax=Myoviridae sp. ctCo31 TaxID=2825053 RepID=A0A8S5UMG9_9CAUD|nr:MAG TPA: hypothetical protein [Myoviridae sp. ctCo31]
MKSDIPNSAKGFINDRSTLHRDAITKESLYLD